MHLTLSQIKTYLNCPDKYMYIYKLGLDTKQLDTRDHFSESIYKTIYHYFYSLLDGKMLTESEMRAKFNELWFKPNDDYHFLFSATDSETKMAVRAANIFNIFHRQEKYNPGKPLEINREINTHIGDHLITLHIDLAREIESEHGTKVQLINFRVSNRAPEAFYLEDDLHMSLSSYAYRTINFKKEDELIYYLLDNGKQELSFRGEGNYQRMKRLINKVAFGIENNVFYPRVSYGCRTCPFQEICKRWPHEFEGAE